MTRNKRSKLVKLDTFPCIPDQGNRPVPRRAMSPREGAVLGLAARGPWATSGGMSNDSPVRGHPRWAWILGAFLLLSALVLAGPLGDFVRSQKKLLVRGFAERRITSDFTVWHVSLAARAKSAKEAFARLQADEARLRAGLVKEGVAAELLEVTSTSVTPVFKTDERGMTTAEISGYTIARNFRVATADIGLVPKFASATESLLRDGLEMNPAQPEFYCQKLKDLRAELLGEAVRDAQKRAEVIAKQAGRRVGGLRSAQQGVFQITPIYSTEISAGGELDTTSLEKSIKAVVSAEFWLK